MILMMHTNTGIHKHTHAHMHTNMLKDPLCLKAHAKDVEEQETWTLSCCVDHVN